MKDQVQYYNQFAKQYRDDILSSANPSLWATDIKEQGPNYQAIRSRLHDQEKILLDHFDSSLPVLDLGCGFGRQALMLAKAGFQITGIDSSNVFIEIAQQLFLKQVEVGSLRPVRLVIRKLLLPILRHLLLN